MLYSVLPLPFETSAVGVCVFAISVPFIIFVGPNVLSAIWIRMTAFSMHIVVVPISFILSAVEPFVDSVACYQVLLPFAVVFGVVAPLVNAVPVFHAIFVVADIFGAIIPDLFTLAVLHIVEPVTFVPRSILVNVNTEPMRLISTKLSNINVSSNMPKSTFTVRLVVQPLTLVHSSVIPLINSISMSFIFLIHLPFILRIFHLIMLHKFEAGIMFHHILKTAITLSKRVLLVDIIANVYLEDFILFYSWG